MKIGYARVSTKEQVLDLQIDALQTAGCEEIYSEHESGAKFNRPQLTLFLTFSIKVTLSSCGNLTGLEEVFGIWSIWFPISKAWVLVSKAYKIT